MKVLLIQPVSLRPPSCAEAFPARRVPMELACLAEALRRAGHNVRLHAREEELTKRSGDRAAADAALRALIAEFHPDMAVLSVATPFLPDAGTVTRMVKEGGDHILTVVCGSHPTLLPERTLADCPSADVAVVGEPERTVVELAANGASDAVAGIAFRRGDSVVRTLPRAPESDVDSLAPPAYDLLDMKHYAAPGRGLIRWLKASAANFRTSRSGQLHSVDYVMEQVLRVVWHYNVQAVCFEDDAFGADRDRLHRLCEAMHGRRLNQRLHWSAALRPEHADRETLMCMRGAGCIQVEYDFQTGSDVLLRRLDPRAAAERNLEAVRLAHQARIRTLVNLSAGLPEETEQDIRATERFLLKSRPDVAIVKRFEPWPDSAAFHLLPDAQRETLDWFRLARGASEPPNLTAIPTAQFERILEELLGAVVYPLTTHQLLRDTPPEDVEERRRLRRALAQFAVRHPVQSARVFA